ncbi:hypothetical protein JTE90_001913 [Oedothorax gibbosus]|uniref:Uncharacterized protein n=1 Tax=Oedothorax gibbosus TaxID=931172 RepID=A0AAV6VTR4_9ARAC|nr:hypothetical protein JTE90_001913 [Oedothorax gibbosus]
MVFKVILISLCVAGSLANHYEHHEEHGHHPQPYKFGYDVHDHHGSQHRQEHGDGHGNVHGSYGFKDDRGIHRQVDYVADHHGFRADVKTNEPGTANQDPAHVHLHSSAHHELGHHGHHELGHHGLEHGHHGYGHDGYHY